MTPEELDALRTAVEALHATLLKIVEAGRRGDRATIMKMVEGDDAEIVRVTRDLNRAFDAAGLGEPFAT